MDPRSCRYYCGGIENGMMNAAAVEMAKYYEFPVIASGFGTDTFSPSIQSGMERSLNAVLPAMAHPDILIGPGLFGGDMILNFEQIILDVETYRNTQQIKRGLKPEDFDWSKAAISQTGPGGNYLTHHSTAKNIRSGNWYIPQLGVHSSFEKWEAEKQQSLVEEARSQVDKILESHECLPFSKEVERELSQIVKSSQKVT